MADIAYVNGNYSALEEAVISINDRGLQFADSLYEVCRASGNDIFFLDWHMERMSMGAEKIGFNASSAIKTIPSIIEEGIEKAGYQNTVIYIQLTRGTQIRNHVPEPGLTPNLIMTFREYKDNFKGRRESGLGAITLPDVRSKITEIKTTNLLPNILAKQAAKNQGCVEAILYDEDNVVTEGSTSSVFIVKDGKVITTPLVQGILPGVTRRIITEVVLPKIGVETEIRHFSIEDLNNADEIFISSTTGLLIPINKINGKQTKSEKMGEVSKKIFEQMKKEFNQFSVN